MLHLLSMVSAVIAVALGNGYYDEYGNYRTYDDNYKSAEKYSGNKYESSGSSYGDATTKYEESGYYDEYGNYVKYGDQGIGCADASTEREVVPNAIYACPGTFGPDNGVYGAEADALCAKEYSVCESSEACANLGMTTQLCENVAVSPTEFFATKQSSSGNGNCGPQGFDDIWGCAQPGGDYDGWLGTPLPCGVLTGWLGQRSINGWVLDMSVTDPKINEAIAYSLTDITGGGVLCCTDRKSGYGGSGSSYKDASSQRYSTSAKYDDSVSSGYGGSSHGTYGSQSSYSKSSYDGGDDKGYDDSGSSYKDESYGTSSYKDNNYNYRESGSTYDDKSSQTYSDGHGAKYGDSVSSEYGGSSKSDNYGGSSSYEPGYCQKVNKQYFSKKRRYRR